MSLSTKESSFLTTLDFQQIIQIFTDLGATNSYKNIRDLTLTEIKAVPQ